MTRPLALGLVLLATAASAADLALATRHLEPARVAPSRKVQWAPSGNFQALHTRAVFRGETEGAARPYGRARGETAAGFGIFLSRDSQEGTLNSAPSLHRFMYARVNPLRYTDLSGHDVGQAEGAEREEAVIAAGEKAQVQGAPTGQVNEATGAIERTAPLGSDDQAIYATLLKDSWKRKGVPVELLAGPKFVERKAIEAKTLGTVLPLVSKQEQLSAILSGMSAADPPFSKTQSAIAPGQSRLEQLGAPGYETRFFGEMAKGRDAMLTGYWAIGLGAAVGLEASGVGEEMAAINAERAAAVDAKVTSEAVERLMLEGKGAAPRRITSGSQVTEEVIRQAMKDAPLQSQQAGGVSLPKVQQYVDKLLAGDVPLPIKVDGNMIVDGNHRYIARQVLGQEPTIQPWAGGRPADAVPWDTIPIDPKEW